jgi:hypothetical protein
MTCAERFGDWAKCLDDAGWSWIGTGGGCDFPGLESETETGEEGVRVALVSGVGDMVADSPETDTEPVRLTVYLDDDWTEEIWAEWSNVHALIEAVGTPTYTAAYEAVKSDNALTEKHN